MGIGVVFVIVRVPSKVQEWGGGLPCRVSRKPQMLQQLQGTTYNALAQHSNEVNAVEVTDFCVKYPAFIRCIAGHRPIFLSFQTPEPSFSRPGFSSQLTQPPCMLQSSMNGPYSWQMIKSIKPFLVMSQATTATGESNFPITCLFQAGVKGQQETPPSSTYLRPVGSALAAPTPPPALLAARAAAIGLSRNSITPETRPELMPS